MYCVYVSKTRFESGKQLTIFALRVVIISLFVSNIKCKSSLTPFMSGGGEFAKFFLFIVRASQLLYAHSRTSTIILYDYTLYSE